VKAAPRRVVLSAAVSVRQRVIALVVVAVTVVAGAAAVSSAAGGVPIGSAARSADPAVRVNPPSGVSTDVDVRAAHALVDAVNAARAARGLPPLRWDDGASRAAHAHAVDMAAMREMRHIGSDGSDAGTRLRAAGVSWSSWGEALGAGSRDAPSLVQAWMVSAGHRAVLLGAFTRIGVGVAMSADGTPYWTLDALS
jgi:uncharacterized protein YkwD